VRLACLFLSAVLAAQTPPGKLPWASAAAVPWKAGDCGPALDPPAPQAAAATPLTLRITQDGTVRITHAKGIITLRSGLPGRPLRAWRDDGREISDLARPMAFPASSPILRGLSALPIGAPDFRPALAGLVWVLTDDEQMVTVIHPATARIGYLPLPGGRHFRLVFRPDRLEVRSGDAPGGAQDECWSVPWLALLPQFLQLGQPDPANRPTGTALIPYPHT